MDKSGVQEAMALIPIEFEQTAGCLALAVPVLLHCLAILIGPVSWLWRSLFDIGVELWVFLVCSLRQQTLLRET